LATKVVVKRTVKKRRLKPHIKATKSLYFLLLGLGLCVVIWFGYQVFNQASKGYNAYNSEQTTTQKTKQNVNTHLAKD